MCVFFNSLAYFSMLYKRAIFKDREIIQDNLGRKDGQIPGVSKPS